MKPLLLALLAAACSDAGSEPCDPTGTYEVTEILTLGDCAIERATRELAVRPTQDGGWQIEPDYNGTLDGCELDVVLEDQAWWEGAPYPMTDRYALAFDGMDVEGTRTYHEDGPPLTCVYSVSGVKIQ